MATLYHIILGTVGNKRIALMRAPVPDPVDLCATVDAHDGLPTWR